MGAVYEAHHDTNFDLRFAVKVLEIDNEDARAMFKNEMKVLATLQNGHIITLVHEGMLQDGKPYFVMPLLGGESLKEMIERAGPLNPITVASILKEVSSGLEAAHAKNVIHRDLKPANIVFDTSGSANIIDFGVFSWETSERSPQQGALTALKGTTQYMAPELFDGVEPSRTTDLFSLAITCYESLTKVQPFDRKTDIQRRKAVAEDIPTPAHRLNPSVPVVLSKILQKGMAKDPIARASLFRDDEGNTSAKEYARIFERAAEDNFPDIFAEKLTVKIEEIEELCKNKEWDRAHIRLREMEKAGETSDVLLDLRATIDPKCADKRLREYIANIKKELKSDPDWAWETMQTAFRGLSYEPARAALENEVRAARLKKRIEEASENLKTGAFSSARKSLVQARRIDQRDTQASSLFGRLRRDESASLSRDETMRKLCADATDAETRGYFVGAVDRLKRANEWTEGGLRLIGGGNVSSAADKIYLAKYHAMLKKQAEVDQDLRQVSTMLELGQIAEAAELIARWNESSFCDHFSVLLLAAKHKDLTRRIEETKDIYAQFVQKQDADERLAFLERHRSHIGDSPLSEFLSNAQAQKELFEALLKKSDSAELQEEYLDALTFLRLAAEVRPKGNLLESRVAELQALQASAVEKERRERFVEQLKRLIEIGDYTSVIQAYNKAGTNCQEDKQITDSYKEALNRNERAKQARERLVRGHSLRHQSQNLQALEVLEEAHSLDPNDFEISQFLGLVHLERAEEEIGTDLSSARVSYERAKTLIPDDPIMQDLSKKFSRAGKTSEAGHRGVSDVPTTRYPPNNPLEPKISKPIDAWDRWRRRFSGALANTIRWIFKKRDDVFGRIQAMPPQTTQSLLAQNTAKYYWIAAIGFAAFVSVAAWVLTSSDPTPPKDPPSTKVSLTVGTTPLGAAVKVDGQDRGKSPVTLLLDPGKYSADITLTGYEPLHQIIEVPGNGSPASFALRPLALAIHLVSDVDGATVSLIEAGGVFKANGAFKEGSFSQQNLDPGVYTLTIAAPKQPSSTTVKIEYAAGRPPEVSLPQRPNIMSIVNYSGIARVTCSAAQLSLKIDDPNHVVDCQAKDGIELEQGEHQAWVKLAGTKQFSFQVSTHADVTIGFWPERSITPGPIDSIEWYISKERFKEAKEQIKLIESQPRYADDVKRLNIKVQMKCQLTNKCNE